MAEQSELVRQTSGQLSKPSKGSEAETTAIVAQAIHRVSLAKNIGIVAGAAQVWAACVIEDIQAGVFTLEDFISAARGMIREKVYNRLDYADFYAKALEVASAREQVEFQEQRAEIQKLRGEK